ncbi:diguanylate cyclase [compost metagenome]
MRNTDKVLDSVTASFGVAFAKTGDTLESLLTRADDALYQAKRNGRNQVNW